MITLGKAWDNENPLVQGAFAGVGIVQDVCGEQRKKPRMLKSAALNRWPDGDFHDGIVQEPAAALRCHPETDCSQQIIRDLTDELS